jgi:hypothetical protein
MNVRIEPEQICRYSIMSISMLSRRYRLALLKQCNRSLSIMYLLQEMAQEHHFDRAIHYCLHGLGHKKIRQMSGDEFETHVRAHYAVFLLENSR